MAIYRVTSYEENGKMCDTGEYSDPEIAVMFFANTVEELSGATRGESNYVQMHRLEVPEPVKHVCIIAFMVVDERTIPLASIQGIDSFEELVKYRADTFHGLVGRA